MINNEMIKVFFIALIIDLIENLLLLFFFNVPITKQTFIAALLFSVVVSFLIDRFIIKQMKGGK